MLSERIKELRKEHGLSQSDLAQRIGVSLGAIKHWEQGRGDPNVAALISIAILFNVSVDYLVGRSEHRALVLDDKDVQRVVEVVHELPEAHRIALLQYAELLRRGNSRV